jgi:hypothetical protein
MGNPCWKEGTLRSWLLGRRHQIRGIKKFSKPLIELPNTAIKQLSFTNLVEALVALKICQLYNFKNSAFSLKLSLFKLS